MYTCIHTHIYVCRHIPDSLLPINCFPNLDMFLNLKPSVSSWGSWASVGFGVFGGVIRNLNQQFTKKSTVSLNSLFGPCCMFSHSVMSDSLQPHGLCPPGFSVHGISQARILEWIAISFSTESSWPRDQTCIGKWVLYLLSHQGLFNNWREERNERGRTEGRDEGRKKNEWGKATCDDVRCFLRSA